MYPKKLFRSIRIILSSTYISRIKAVKLIVKKKTGKSISAMKKELIKIRQLETCEKLKPFVKKITVFEGDNLYGYKQKLTPSPYNYLSYNNKEIPASIIGKKYIKPDSNLMFAGIKTDEIFVKYEGDLQQILIEFTASGFYYLFRQSPVKFKNRLVEPYHFFSYRAVYEAINELCAVDNIEDQKSIIEKLLELKIKQAAFPNVYVERSINLIERNHGAVKIKDIAGEAGVSERQLNRKFREITGISPKKFSKILQLHYLIYLIRKKEYPLQEIVFRGYFYDRPHFTHTFKELTGMTPVEFIHSSKHIAFEYFTAP